MPHQADHASPDEETLLINSARVVEVKNTMSSPAYWKVGALFGAVAVALGAFGAHGLKQRISDPQRLANWSTAAQYQVPLGVFGTLPLCTANAPDS